jgi:hypothetical protein
MGSVAAINTPKSAAPIQFQFNRKRTPRATADAAINTPGKAKERRRGKLATEGRPLELKGRFENPRG